MLKENERIFERCNIPQWHEAGYTGKGVKIGVIDLDNHLFDWQEDKVTKIEPTNFSAGGHCAKCFSILMQIAPDAEYYLLPGSGTKAYLKALELDIDIVSASIAGWKDNDVDKVFGKEDCTTIVFGASGNEGGADCTDQNYPASYDWSICVAGVTANTDKFYTTSSRNDDMDCCGYTVVPIRCNGDYIVPFNGTSCATPWAAGVYALYRQKVGKQNWQQAKEFIHKNCIDYLDEGWDNWSGYGLFVLPDVEEIDMKIEMKIGSKEAFIDGKPVELLRAPEEQGGTTLVPIRFVAEALGCKVDYEHKTKKITITK